MAQGAGGGRPAKPTALKVLHGDNKHDPQRINRQEPKPADQPVEPPWQLTEGAQAIWDEMASDRIRVGVLTAWDARSFALFCEALAVAQDAAMSREMYQPAAPGAPSPMSRFKDAVAICGSLGGRFGWTPADRQKLIVGGQQEDPKERLLS